MMFLTVVLFILTICFIAFCTQTITTNQVTIAENQKKILSKLNRNAESEGTRMGFYVPKDANEEKKDA